jgi:hypothetical protein
MNIILPVAGKSSRFPDVRPKWLLINPNGNFMIVDAIIGMEVENIESLNILYLKEHELKFQFKKGLLENLEKYNIHNKINFIELENQTEHQVETVRQGLIKIEKNIPFLIKDCDNIFKLNYNKNEDNFVSYCTLNKNKITDIGSKSYLQLDKFNIINNIVEKKIISDKFCCGGYFFKNSTEFLKYSNFNANIAFISDVVFNMILNKIPFIGIEATNYEDLGTLTEWYKYKNQFLTLFIDIDGTLIYNSSAYMPPYIGDTSIIEDNVKCLKEYIETEKVEVILTTSRPEKYRQITEDQLKNTGIKYKHLIMNLQHCKRIIINDFSNTNPYKSCEAINIPRNTETLRHYLKT